MNIETETNPQLEKALTEYIRERKSAEECIGFIDGFKQGQKSNNKDILNKFINEIKNEFKDQNWDYLEFIADRI